MSKRTTNWFIATNAHDHTNEVLYRILHYLDIYVQDDDFVIKLHKGKSVIMINVTHQVAALLKEQKKSRPPGEIKFRLFFNHDNGKQVEEWKWDGGSIRRTAIFKKAKKAVKNVHQKSKGK